MASGCDQKNPKPLADEGLLAISRRTFLEGSAGVVSLMALGVTACDGGMPPASERWSDDTLWQDGTGWVD